MKLKKKWIMILVIAAALGLPFLLACCGVIARYSERVQLTDNYRYLRTPEGVVVSYDLEKYKPELLQRMHQGWRPPGVGPGVDGYRVYRRVIVGHVAGRQGYFIIDLRRDTLQKGLNKQEWLEKLRSYGIEREPELFKPSWYDEVLGRNKVCEE